MPTRPAYALMFLMLIVGCVQPNVEFIAMNERAYTIESQLDREAANLDRMKQDVAAIRHQVELMQGSEISSRIAAVEGRISSEEGAMGSELKVKVLGRYGLDPARSAAARLLEHGIPVSTIDLAPADDGTTTTAIYFNEGYEHEAREAAAALGGGVVLRPMKWPSIFDLIIIVSNRT